MRAVLLHIGIFVIHLKLEKDCIDISFLPNSLTLFVRDKLVGRTFSVTQDDIECGHRRMPISCPVALSISENINKGGIVSVSQYSIGISFQKVDMSTILISAKPSSELANWIIDFDTGKEVSPLELVVGNRVNKHEKDGFDVELNIVDR
jgi:hypothetical protein